MKLGDPGTVELGGVAVPVTKSGKPDRRYKRAMRSAGRLRPEVFREAKLVIEPVVEGRGAPGGAGGRVDDPIDLPTSTEPVRQQVSAYRQWCRDVVASEEVQAEMRRRAMHDADFALKLAAHGFGNTPQQVQIQQEINVSERKVYVVQVAGGGVVNPAIAGLPDSRLLLDGDGRHNDQRSSTG